MRVVHVMTLGSIPALTISSRVWKARASCPALPQALIRAEYVTRLGSSPRARISCSQENASSTFSNTTAGAVDRRQDGKIDREKPRESKEREGRGEDTPEPEEGRGKEGASSTES